jgi:esterase
MDEQELDEADIIGHSLGGKIAMGLALHHPTRVSRLVVVDICPVKYPDLNPQSHPVHALARLNLSSVSSRQAADQMLAKDVADPVLRGFLLQNLVVDSKYKSCSWRCNLTELVAQRSHYNDFPFTPTKLHTPTLFIRGTQSDFTKQEYMNVIPQWFSNFQYASILDANHWPHFTHPKEFVGIVSPFLSSQH